VNTQQNISSNKSCIYTGKLRHRRFLPRLHEFIYDACLFYIDLSELSHLFNRNTFWSFNRSNFGSFKRKDYFGNPSLPLDQAVRDHVKKELGYCPDGEICLLTQLRIFGFCFNPVSFYFIFNKSSPHPKLILAEVNNTPWNKRHTYLLTCDDKGNVKTEFDKDFHVSPFNPLDMQYHWISSSPSDHLVIHMENHKISQGENLKYMDATLTLKREDWSVSKLNSILWRQPWLAIKTPAAIYWQAIKLFFKGVPVYSQATTATTATTATLAVKSNSQSSVKEP